MMRQKNNLRQEEENRRRESGRKYSYWMALDIEQERMKRIEPINRENGYDRQKTDR